MAINGIRFADCLEKIAFAGNVAIAYCKIDGGSTEKAVFLAYVGAAKR